eukprot:Rhum_TRINITY_DN13235_c0_g1::Rhum_TRINITY_DN13235_c0_g1_i1::g.58348::m.58348
MGDQQMLGTDSPLRKERSVSFRFVPDFSEAANNEEQSKAGGDAKARDNGGDNGSNDGGGGGGNPFGNDGDEGFEEAEATSEDNDDMVLFTPWERVRAKKAAKARSFLIEMMAYFLFIILFCVTVFGLRSPWMYYSAEAVRNRLKLGNTDKGGFLLVSDTNGFYTYLEDILVPNVYPTQWYNGNERTSYEKRFAGMHNRLVGTTRLRQIRVAKNVDCRVSDKFSAFVRDCYPPFSSSAESEAAYGPAHNRTKYRYSSTGDLCDFSPIPGRHCSSLSIGKSGQSYPSGGFVTDLPLGSNMAQQIVQELKDDAWVDHQTRAVAIDLTFYNANTHLIIVLQLLCEWLPTGTVLTKISVKPTPALTLENDRERASLALEVILQIYLFVYLVNEVTDFYSYKRIPRSDCITCKRQMILREGLEKVYVCLECHTEFNPFSQRRCGKCLTEYSPERHLCWKGYFQDPWHWLDMINLLFFIIVFGLRFRLRADLAKVAFSAGPRFILMFPLAGQFSISNYLNSVNALLCFIKTFKYLGKFSQLAVLIRTLSHSRQEIAYFLVIFAVIFTGFALAFQLGFGGDVEDYRSFADSLMSLFRMLLGEFDYAALEKSNRVLAPLFFTFYNVLVLFVLSNMFIAIVSGAYAVAITEASSGDEFLSSSLRLFFNNLIVQFNRLIGRDSMITDILLLIERLQAIQGLTTEERGDLTVFLNEVEHKPDDNDLFNHVLAAFDRRVNREMTHEDFLLMKAAVSEHYKRRREDEDEAEASAGDSFGFAQVVGAAPPQIVAGNASDRGGGPAGLSNSGGGGHSSAPNRGGSEGSMSMTSPGTTSPSNRNRLHHTASLAGGEASLGDSVPVHLRMSAAAA